MRHISFSTFSLLVIAVIVQELELIAFGGDEKDISLGQRSCFPLDEQFSFSNKGET